ncbi:MFS transporter [Aurantiacibacter marinus]|uniref:MFS transporter n=1 Tax=Aurantiacibacter marinus TaxID=874156 RepID=A0A0H0XQH4_9SPHN|nr:MFS transporter [Aurantiacibacter marinus]KLI64818.1 hypothetical protein AAV99_04725 [Aurantiacibacter marinus]
MASIALAGDRLILTRSKPLRLLTLFLFYFTQGFPLGVFFYAVPAWMAAGGAGTAEIATVVAAANLPWTLKLIDGFIIDRYTYLPMGRRRVWIIGAQSLITLSFLALALFNPVPTEVTLIAAMAFAANVAVTFQDVGIDSLAVDIMEEEERSYAASMMMASQLLGLALATWAGGQLFEAFGLPIGIAILSIVPATVMLYGIAIRERGGEKRLPWTSGQSHRENLEVQVDAWRPLIKGAALAMIPLLSIILIPVMASRSVAYGVIEAYFPELFTQQAGWTMSEYTDLISLSSLFSGILGLVLGGYAVQKIGTQRALIVAIFGCAALPAAFGLLPGLWAETWFLRSYVFAFDLLAFFVLASAIPLCMRMCVPAVAATQFTLYMGLGNLGRPVGNAMAAWADGIGQPTLMFFGASAVCAVSGTALLFVRYPRRESIRKAVAQKLVQGEGIVPRRD